jgi:hypothetical protein
MERVRIFLGGFAFLPLLHVLVEEGVGVRRRSWRNPSPFPSPRYAGRGHVNYKFKTISQ